MNRMSSAMAPTMMAVMAPDESSGCGEGAGWEIVGDGDGERGAGQRASSGKPQRFGLPRKAVKPYFVKGVGI